VTAAGAAPARRPPAPRRAWAARGAPEAALFLLAAALAAITIRQEIGPHDEGLIVLGAERIANGEWPYRDFWTNYVPGQFLLVAVPTKLLGQSLLWWRIIRVALDGLVAVLGYRLIRPLAGQAIALAAWLGVAGAMAWPNTPNPNPAALALVLGALVLARPGGERRLMAAAVLCGIAALFRLELGAAGALAVALMGGGWRALGLAAVVGLALLAPFFAVAPGDMVDDVLGFFSIQGLQRLPVPLHYHGPLRPNKLLEFYFAAILLAGTALWAAFALVRRPGWVAPAAPLVLVSVAYLLGRPDEFHLVPLAVVLALALAAAAGDEPSRPARWALLAILGLVVAHGLDRRVGQLLHPAARAAVPSPVADGVRTTRADAASLRGLLGRIDALVPRGAAIFVAPPRFDAVRTGDPLLYVLAERSNPTRYDVMQPGVVTTAHVQREIVADLRRARPAVVVRWLDPRARPGEPNGSARSSGVRLVDDYLAATYDRAERFGVYLLLRRRDRR
jgi:hypothetical protein